MAKVDPFVAQWPNRWMIDPELSPTLNYLDRFLHDLWQRSGGGDDLLTETLVSIGALGTAADKMLYTTGVSTFAESDLTAYARGFLDDATEAEFHATINLEIGVDVQAYSANLDEADTFFGLTNITGAEAETLTDTSNADALHAHDHDQLTGFVSDEHVAHTGVSITAGNGLTGGGAIDTTRTLDVVGGNGITVNANDIEIDTTVVIDKSGITTYVPTNDVADRAFDANAASGAISATPTQAEVENIRDAVLELSDVVATLVSDLGLT